MIELTGSQRTRLRGLAHDLKPAVQIGKEGAAERVVAAIAAALDAVELIKIRFVGFRDEKRELIADMETRLGATCVGIVGNVAIVYRPHPDPARRKIRLA